MRILICGQRGSGKTTLARELVEKTGANWYDGDEVRKAANDWDFSIEGRMRQARRMRKLCGDRPGLKVASFICPTAEMREAFSPDLTIFMDTVLRDGSVEIPTNCYTVRAFHPDHVARIVERIPQALMIGRYQPWHAGHEALFLAALQKYGYVNIQVRRMPQGPDNPYPHFSVRERIEKALIGYEGCYRITSGPDVRAVVYGRDVGYAIDKIQLPAEIEAISATAIRSSQNV